MADPVSQHGAGALKIVVPPVMHAVPVSELEAWVSGARAGEQLVYAWGALSSPPRASATVCLARELAEAGLVRTHNRRSERGWDFLCVRVSPSPERAAAPVASPRGEAETPEDRLLAVVRRCAAFRLPFPKNEELAQLIGVEGVAEASYRLRKLAGAGEIRVIQNGPKLPRVVTICATGETSLAGQARNLRQKQERR